MNGPSPSGPTLFDLRHPAQLVLLGILLVVVQQLLLAASSVLVGDIFVRILIASVVGFIFLPQLLIHRSGAELTPTLALHPLRWAQIPWLMLLALSLVLPINFIGELNVKLVSIPPEFDQMVAELSPHGVGGWILAVSSLCIFVPLGEEIVFRGIVHRACRVLLPPMTSAVLSGLLFAVLHFEPWFVGGLAVLGIALGLALESTGSLWAAVLLHAFYNTAVMILQNTGGEMEEPAFLSGAIGAVLAALSLALAWISLQRLNRRATSPTA